MEATVVVNEFEDRDVKLFEDHNNILTKTETEKEFDLQSVTENF